MAVTRTITDAINGSLPEGLSLCVTAPGTEGQSGEPAVFALTGDLDMENAQFCKDRIRLAVFAYERVCLVLDMTGVDYIDSHGLTVLAEAKRWTMAAGGGLALAGLQGQAKRLLDMILADMYFLILPTTEEAIKALKTRQAPSA